MSDLGVSPDLRGSVFKPDLSGGLGSALGRSLEAEIPKALASDEQSRAMQRAAGGAIIHEIDSASQRRKELTVPKPPPPMPPPEFQQTSPVQQWGSMAMGMAMLGSAFTRRPAINALNAAAGVMNAYHDGDAEAYKRNFDHWKATSDYSLKMYEYQREAYRDALADIDKDVNGAMQKGRVVAEMFKDDAMSQLMKIGNVAGVIDKLKMSDFTYAEAKAKAEDVQRHGELLHRAMDAQQRLQRNPQDVEAARELQSVKELAALEQQMKGSVAGAGHWQVATDPTKKDEAGNPVQYRYNPTTGESTTLDMKPYTPGGFQKVGTSTQGPPDQKTVDATAHAIASYQQAPLGAWAMAKPFGQQVMAKVYEINPDYQQAQYQARVSATRAFTSGKQADAVRSFSVSLDHLATLEELGRALENGDVQAINRVKQRYLQETGHEAPLNFDFAKTIVGDEVAKAVIGGVGAHADREALQAGFNRANSWEQLAGVAHTAKKLIAGQLSGFRRQYEKGTGQPDFDTLLSDEARKELGSLERGRAGGNAASPPPYRPTITNQKDYDALPVGADYLDANGNPHTKRK